MPEAPVMPEVSAPPTPPAEPPKSRAQREVEEFVLPTLFGAGYGTYKTRKSSFLYSYGFIIAVTLVFVLVATMVKAVIPIVEEHTTEVYLPSPPPMMGPNGGGGAHDKTPASKGVLPKQERQPLTPPAVQKVEEPKLPELPSVIGKPTPPVLAQLGDPLGKIGGPPSNGPGGGGGIGGGYGGGVGNGRGAYRVGGGVSAPVATFQPDPEYSEEARKAKYQGEVMLWVIVGADGKAHDIRVARSLGLGLDEKAMEAVKNWRFEPGKKDGTPVAVQIQIEVDFHLL